MFIDRCYLNNFFFDRLGLQMGQLFGIAVKVEQLRNSIWLTKRGVNIHMTVSAPGREIFVLQFVQTDDLDDRLGMRPWLNRKLVAF